MRELDADRLLMGNQAIPAFLKMHSEILEASNLLVSTRGKGIPFCLSRHNFIGCRHQRQLCVLILRVCLLRDHQLG